MADDSPTSPASLRLPVFINPDAGSATEVERALCSIDGVELRKARPDEFARAIAQALEEGHTRICVAGGDGSIAAAATALREQRAELAIVPGGTLNHFARDLELPLDHAEAARIARGAHTIDVDLGVVNDRLFLNTSSVGAYVTFVQWRERLEPRLGYWIASVVAGLRILFRLRTFRVTLTVEGVEREYRTPLVFIGVGERELKIPTLGKRVPNGQRGLHVIVLRTRSGARAVATALAAAARGIERVSHTPELDSFLVDECTITAPFRKLAVDGELVAIRGPLAYGIARDALRVVVPESKAE